MHQSSAVSVEVKTASETKSRQQQNVLFLKSKKKREKNMIFTKRKLYFPS